MRMPHKGAAMSVSLHHGTAKPLIACSRPIRSLFCQRLGNLPVLPPQELFAVSERFVVDRSLFGERASYFGREASLDKYGPQRVARPLGLEKPVEIGQAGTDHRVLQPREGSDLDGVFHNFLFSRLRNKLPKNRRYGG
jgi:hypothetical protein